MRLPYSAAAAAALISCAAARAGAGSCACRLLCAASQIPVCHISKNGTCSKKENTSKTYLATAQNIKNPPAKNNCFPRTRR